MPGRRPETLERLAQRNAAIVAAHRAEPLVSYAELGQRFGLCESGVCLVLRNARAQSSRSERRADRDAEILAMSRRAPSPTLVEIGRHFNLCPTSVHRAIRRAQEREDRLAALNKARTRRATPPSSMAIATDVKRLKPRIAPQLATVPAFTAISRDPCIRCGVRGDIGCSHRSVP